MPNAVANIEPVRKELDLIGGNFEQVLEGSGIPVERFKRSVLFSLEKNPRLLEARRQSLMAAAMSAAVLQLECDGVTGQSFLIPFGKEVQCVIGYKGFNTLAARAGCTVTGEVVREGDEFDYDEGTTPFVRHKRKLGNEGTRPIIAAYATMTHKSRPPVVKVMSIDEINEVRDRSPSVKAGKQTPWKDPKIGFPAMAAKTVMRRLARSMPMNTDAELRFHLAAAMDERHEELGGHAYIQPGPKLIVDGQEHKDPNPPAQPTADDLEPPAYRIIGSTNSLSFKTALEMKSAMMARIATADSKRGLNAFIKQQVPALEEAKKTAPETVDEIQAAYKNKLRSFD